MTRSEKDLDIHWGVGMDIFPLFKNDTATLSFKKKVAHFLLELVVKRPYVRFSTSKLKKWIRKCMLAFIPKKADVKIIEKCLTILNEASPNAPYLLDACETPYRGVWKKEVFGEGRLCKFEDIEAIVPSDADGYLRQLYGDYMVLPKEQDRIDHGDLIVDLERDYTNYK